MREYRPIIPYKEMDSREWKLWRQVDEWNRQVATALGAVGRNVSPDQQQEPPAAPPQIDDHGLLKGLVPVVASDGTITDYNDDHTQYPLIFGRPAGQSIYGSRPGAPTSWVALGTAILGAATSGGASTWTTNSATGVRINLPPATGVVLVNSSHTSNSLAGGETAYHTSITDTGGNTWTKLKEFSYLHGGSTEHVSLWFSLVTTALTAGTSTLTANFSTADHIRFAMEAYAFTMAAGLSVTLVSYTTDGSTVSYLPTAMPATAPIGEALFVRAIGSQPTSGSYEPSFTPSSGFTGFTADHTLATNGGLGFGQSARGEFIIISGTGPTSAPSFYPTADDYSVSSIFAVIQISGSAIGSLTLGAANLSDAALIKLVGRDTTFVAGIGGGKFQFDPLGSVGFVGILNFDSIAGSSKTYTFPNSTGTIALTSDLSAYLKLDASNDPLTGTLDTQIIEPSQSAAYDIGTSGLLYRDLFLSRDLNLGRDIVLTTTGTQKFGTPTLALKEMNLFEPTTTQTNYQANTFGILSRNTTNGDLYFGPSTEFVGFYWQASVKAGASGRANEATNIFQGNWGSGATAAWPFIEMNWQCGDGTTGIYTGVDTTANVRAGAVTMGAYVQSNALGGGGLLIFSRGVSSVAGNGLYIVGDETNQRMTFRLLRASTTKAAQNLNAICFAGGTNGLNKILAETDATVDLGISLTNAWKNLFLNGYAELEAIAAPSALEGRTWNDSTRSSLAGYYAGIARVFCGSLFEQTASVTVANTTVETTLVGSGSGTPTLPANFLVAGRVLRIRAWGYYGTQLTGASTLRIKGYLGSTAILDTTAKSPAANISNRIWQIEAQVTCRSTGAAGTVFAQGNYNHDDALAYNQDWTMLNTGTTTVDTTVSQAISLKVTWGAGVAAADTITCTNLSIEAMD